MSKDLVIPSVLNELNTRLREWDTSFSDLQQVLRALQRLGLSKQDMEIHLERIRAVNDATEGDETLERNAVNAIDIVVGGAGDLSLSWDSQEIARISLPRVVDDASILKNSPLAVSPSDMLPSRPSDSLTHRRLEPQLDRLSHALRGFEYVPVPADVYRVPKNAFTTRPAALLALPDRLVFEALVGDIESNLEKALPSSVLWPRKRGDVPDATEFNEVPHSWDDRYVVKADLERFYESVEHSLLAMILAAELGATKAQTRAVESFLGTVMDQPFGLPQGPLASDILASTYLMPIDHRLYALGWRFARFADDYVIAASSMADGRHKLAVLESYLGQLGLYLNDNKTGIMRVETYVKSTGSQPAAIVALKERLRQQWIEEVAGLEDTELAAEALEEVSVDDEVLWAVLYHGTMSIEDVIEQVADDADATREEVYAVYLRQITQLLSQSRIPEDMGAVEQTARESITYLAAWRNAPAIDGVRTCLTWFPGLAPTAAAYYLSVGEIYPERVDPVLVELISSDAYSDWTKATLCQAARARSTPLSRHLVRAFRQIATRESTGPLTRTASLWTLAEHDALGPNTFKAVQRWVSPSLRADIWLTVLDTPEKYQWLPGIRKQLHAPWEGE